tara:strand:+ start:3356 stop:4831 length:1476 start_codon:yes stop_codon:yes gene_type:complete
VLVIKNKYLEFIIIILTGALYTFSFAPIDFKIGIFISLILFLYILSNSSKKASIFKSFLYGVAVFASGVSWIFNSIYYHGGEDIFVSSIITFSFILLLSIFFIPLGYFINKENDMSRSYMPVIVASIWVLLEFIRSHIFTGFPWLLVGTSQTGTFFDSLYPIFGTYIISFFVVMISMMVTVFILSKSKIFLSKLYFLFLIFLFILINFFPIYTTDSQKSIKMTVIQPNIHLGIKFDERELKSIKRKYLQIIDNKIHSLIVLPETAIPEIYQLDKTFYEKLRINKNINIIAGVFNYNHQVDEVYNSILVLNDNETFYNKRHLVPFGEYTPFESIFGIIGKVLNIPMSNLGSGDFNQKDIKYENVTLHTLICYEIAYPYLIKTNDDYGVIINVSNDAWFGDSFAPHQHLQIAQTRALESSRPVIRAANTGISAVIDKNGNILDQIQLNDEGYINAEIYPSRGITPYMYFGDYPLLMIIFSIMLLYWKYNKKYG